jgi:hypothetical protein
MKPPLVTPRSLGVMFLAIAAIQLILGFTVLQGRLGAGATLLYWAFCLLATLGAILCAMVDALRNLTESRRERRVLLEQTLREIDAERNRRKSGTDREASESH